ncbi:MAG: hypothetical protein M1275_00560 [Patescibacteria group bacterium]|nr:hypothetical protein [Patescibacteria group bacterium]
MLTSESDLGASKAAQKRKTAAKIFLIGLIIFFIVFIAGVYSVNRLIGGRDFFGRQGSGVQQAEQDSSSQLIAEPRQFSDLKSVILVHSYELNNDTESIQDHYEWLEQVNKNHTFELWLADAYGKKIRRLTEPLLDLQFVSWSPDNKLILATISKEYVNEGGGEYIVIDVGKGGFSRVNINSDRGGYSEVSWFDNSTLIYLTDNKLYKKPLFGKEQLVFEIPKKVHRENYRYLYTLNQQFDAVSLRNTGGWSRDVMVYDLKNDKFIQKNADFIAWGGRTYYYFESNALRRYDLDNGSDQLIKDFGPGMNAWPRVLNDGKAELSFNMRPEKDFSELDILDLDSGEVVLYEPVKGFYFSNFTPDGKFQFLKTADLKWYIMSISGKGQPVPLDQDRLSEGIYWENL